MSSLIYINYYTNIKINKEYKLASFDLDGTLIKTKSGLVFPKDKNDWIIWHPAVKTIMTTLSKDPDTLIVIFSNQKGLGKPKFVSVEDFQDKIHNIRKFLGFNFIFIAALEDDINRKPRIGMFNYLIKKEKINVDIKNSFYVGDFAGRSTDKGDTDYKLAYNLKFKFYTPEQFFLNDTTKHQLNLTGYTLDNTSRNTKIDIKSQPKTMVIISGYPGSGKSHLAKKFIGFDHVSRDEYKNNFNKKLIEIMEKNKSVVVEGLYPSNKSRQDLINIATKYNYTTYYINVNTSYELSYHMNLYRSLYDSKARIPNIVYLKYRKDFEPLNKKDWNHIIEYHPHITRKMNKYYLF